MRGRTWVEGEEWEGGMMLGVDVSLGWGGGCV